jgi:hypothetical protein
MKEDICTFAAPRGGLPWLRVAQEVGDHELDRR